jgi:osmoprotectant transport system ATP-binding protein
MSDQPHGVTAGDLMALPPAPILPVDELRSAMRALLDAGLIAQPVTDDAARLLGLLDEADLLVLAEDRHVVEQDHHPPAVHVSARCEHAAEVMADPHVGVLPVIDDEGRVVGVLTRRSLLEAWWAGRLC